MNTSPVSSTMQPKRVAQISPAPAMHWVGDGFPVHGMFGYHAGARERSPFLMLDYAAPTHFPPNLGEPRGVGAHPHRGFETVTIVYEGAVTHRDSAGGGGTIQAGDVQWMTAGAGIVHDEFHAPDYSRSGGAFHMVQLWVNLPARDKLTAAGYQAITNAEIPQISLEKCRARLIAGELNEIRGAAKTFTPMNVWDLQLDAQADLTLAQPEGWTTLLLVQAGAVNVNGHSAQAKQLVTLSHDGQALTLQTAQPARVLLLAGEPIDEPIVGHGPFVMNTRQEIMQAIDDFNRGRFGALA